MRKELARQLTGDEGVVPHAYQDHLGFWTIGIGRLVDKRKPGSGLRPVEMEFMLQNDIEDRIKALADRLPWFSKLSDARQGVLVNMSFQLGVEGLLKFKATLGRVEAGDYERAATQMLTSLWAKQTPARAKRMAAQMLLGVWQFSG